MKRKIIVIDQEKCNGCGICAEACHEGAIGMVDGKAQLLREDYCDGLGDCLPACPTGAITFEEREAPAYDHAAVQAAQAAKQAHNLQGETLPCGCPGTHSHTIAHSPVLHAPVERHEPESMLAQWPVQLKLVPVNAPYFNGAKLLIAADCTAFAHGDFHRRFMAGHLTLIGCPKLDEGDYADKLTEILRLNDVRSVTVARMEVPCCGGIEHAVKRALQQSGKMLPWQVVVIGTDGRVIDE